MVGLKSGKEFLKILNAIPYTGEQPIGCFLVAPPGSGKSYLLTNIHSKDFIIVSDITGFGLEKLVLEITEKKTGYVVVPDLLRATSRKQSFEQLVSLLNIILEEGLRVIKRCNLDIELKEPLRFGFITAITDTEYEKIVKNFWSTGLLSRLIIFSFYYQPSDVEKIHKMVASGEDNLHYHRINGLKPSAPSINKKLISKISDMAKFLGKDKYGFRSVKLIRRLAKANALLNGRSQVSIKDLKDIFCFLPFISHGDAFKVNSGSDLHYIILKYLTKKPISSDIVVKGYREEEVKDVIADLIQRGFVKMDKNGLRLKF